MKYNRNKKIQTDFKDVQDRIISFFESKGNLVYERVDVQNNPDIQYFKAVCFGNFEQCVSDKNNMRSVATTSWYFSTADAPSGVSSREELPEQWVKKFIDQNKKYAEANNDKYPEALKALICSSISELQIKMGILGI